MSKISLKHSGGNVVSLNSPTSAPTLADVAFKLPNQDGNANEYLKTDGSGNLSFAAAGGGKILQVVQKVLDVSGASYFSTSSQSFVEITGLAQTLTLASSSNKVLIEVNLHTVVMGASNMRSRSQLRFGAFSDADGLSTNVCGVYNVNGASGTEYVYVPHTHRVLHTPATASPTYRVGIRLMDSSQSLYVYADGNSDGLESSVTFMEVEV